MMLLVVILLLFFLLEIEVIKVLMIMINRVLKLIRRVLVFFYLLKIIILIREFLISWNMVDSGIVEEIFICLKDMN